MDDDQKRRTFQKVKAMSKDTFWSWMNQLHTRAYALGIDHMKDAMSCQKRISKPMINQVLLKAEEIRELWDGLKMVTVDGTEGTEYKTADQIAQGFDSTEAAIYKLTEPHILHIGDKKFVIRPATEAEIQEAENGMNIAKLYEMQKTLDARIIEEKNLQGQDLLPNTILALQVELGEMSNEWRGFKHWSDKREPKHGYKAKINCTSCGGRGHWYTGNKVDCNKCETTGTITNPFLEEYVDCFHFFLSIARQLGLDEKDLTIIDDYLEGSTTNVLTRLIYHAGGIGMNYSPYSGITSYRMAFNMFFALGRQRFGFTLEQIEAAYLEKNKVNHERQANGY